jgi:hypothetical protein
MLDQSPPTSGARPLIALAGFDDIVAAGIAQNSARTAIDEAPGQTRQQLAKVLAVTLNEIYAVTRELAQRRDLEIRDRELFPAESTQGRSRQAGPHGSARPK